MKKLLARRSWALLRIFLPVLAISGMISAYAGTLTVTTLADNGPGSLRQALSDNTSLGGGNAIIFSNIVSGTITLSSAELTVAASVIIRGPGTEVLAISGNKIRRVFTVTAG